MTSSDYKIVLDDRRKRRDDKQQKKIANQQTGGVKKKRGRPKKTEPNLPIINEEQKPQSKKRVSTGKPGPSHTEKKKAVVNVRKCKCLAKTITTTDQTLSSFEDFFINNLSRVEATRFSDSE